MSLNIQVIVPEDVVKADQASSYIGRALAAIGFARNSGVGQTSAAEGPVKPAEAPAPATQRRNSRKPAPAAQTEPAADTAEDQAQDAVNEADEVETDRDPKNPLTLEDVKIAMNSYVIKYGMAATQEDGPKIFIEALGKPPTGEAYWKLSLVPEDQETLAKLVAIWGKATDLNPLKRATV